MSGSYVLEKCSILSMSGSVANDSTEYIFDVKFSPSQSQSSASMSDQTIRVVDSELNPLVTLTGHRSTIVGLAYVDETTLFSAAMSGETAPSAIGLWDTRAGSGPRQMLDVRGSEVASLALGIGNALLAVAQGSSVVFYDPRKLGAPLGKYSDCHTDDVTTVTFNPTSSNVLASTGEDGLICVFNCAVAAQDDAVVSIINTDGPVRKCGFFGPEDQGLWSLSCTEQASFWHSTSAQRLLALPDVRDTMEVDYLVDCFQNPSIPVASDPSALLLLGGTYDGTGKLWSVQPTGGLTLVGDLTLGHQAMLRSAAVQPSHVGGPRIVTAGEDARLCSWRPVDVSGLSGRAVTARAAGRGGGGVHGGKNKPGRGSSTTSKYTPY